MGWLVRDGSLEDFRRAIRLSHTLWGGRFNPIIPVQDRSLASDLIRTFQVDCLYNVADSPEVAAVLSDFKHLMWPTFEKELFVEGPKGRTAAFTTSLR
jgi:hypothetical protein